MVKFKWPNALAAPLIEKLDSKTERSEMLVNAASFPGPALWQGVMLCAIPLWLWFAFRKDGKHLAVATGAYVVFGVVLAAAIIVA